MDIEMPVMNGLEATRNIRQFQTEGLITGHIPIMAITANARSEQMNIARESGMDDVVSKPFTIPDLVRKMELFLGPLLMSASKKSNATLKRVWSTVQSS
jgi:CheY-like chemotaxis protein